MNMVPGSYFICGTPSNKRGFECCAEPGVVLPGIPAAYLDRVTRTKLKSSGFKSISRELIDGMPATLMVWYRPIEPSDAATNRGAYIAVGYLCMKPIDMVDAVAVVAKLVVLHSLLDGLRDAQNRFAQTFRLEDVNLLEVVEPLCALHDADLLLQASRAQHLFREGTVMEFDELEYGDIGNAHFSRDSLCLHDLENTCKELQETIVQERQVNGALQQKCENLSRKIEWQREQLIRQVSQRAPRAAKSAKDYDPPPYSQTRPLEHRESLSHNQQAHASIDPTVRRKPRKNRLFGSIVGWLMTLLLFALAVVIVFWSLADNEKSQASTYSYPAASGNEKSNFGKSADNGFYEQEQDNSFDSTDNATVQDETDALPIPPTTRQGGGAERRVDPKETLLYKRNERAPRQ